MAQSPKNIVIVGGSLGGLFVGVALKHLNKNLNIRILERNPTPLLHDQGAGVVAGHETQAFFKKYDQTNTPLTVTSHQRQYLDRTGMIIHQEDSVQQMTSWDLLYHVLRANFDGVESEYIKEIPDSDQDPNIKYEHDNQVTSISSTSPYPSPLKLHIKQSNNHTSTTNADLIIAADGPSSTIRSLYHPSIQRTYAGYVAWRGTVPESHLSTPTTTTLSSKFTFFHTSNTQILAYLIPGPNGTLTPGSRLMNWVWYCNYPSDSASYHELMTDSSGKRHHITLPPGGIRDEIWQEQKQHAASILPPQFAELVDKTDTPFVQAITDVVSERAVLEEEGRVVLVGDALAGFRPHTAGSTGQAAMNAMEVAEVVERIVSGNEDAVEEWRKWEEKVVKYAKEVQRHGVEIGDKSQFGKHEMSG